MWVLHVSYLNGNRKCSLCLFVYLTTSLTCGVSSCARVLRHAAHLNTHTLKAIFSNSFSKHDMIVHKLLLYLEMLN